MLLNHHHLSILVEDIAGQRGQGAPVVKRLHGQKAVKVFGDVNDQAHQLGSSRSGLWFNHITALLMRS